VPAQASQGAQQLARLDRQLRVLAGGQQLLPVERLAAGGVSPLARPVVEERLVPANAKQPEALVAGDDPEPADNRLTLGLASQQLEPGEGTGVLGQLLRPAEPPRGHAQEEALMLEEQRSLVAAAARNGPRAWAPWPALCCVH
jgi:hypothetical protein